VVERNPLPPLWRDFLTFAREEWDWWLLGLGFVLLVTSALAFQASAPPPADPDQFLWAEGGPR
jgi:hypothetical protein